MYTIKNKTSKKFKIVKLSSKNQLTIPAEFLRLGKYPKEAYLKVVLDLQTGEILLEQLSDPLEGLMGSLKDKMQMTYQEAMAIIKENDKMD